MGVKNFFCGSLRSPVILSDGRVTTCTADNYGHNTFAHIGKDNFNTVVEIYKYLRIEIASSSSSLPGCIACQKNLRYWDEKGFPKAKLYKPCATNKDFDNFFNAFDADSFSLNIELTSLCNLRCMGCSMSKGGYFRQTRQKAMIDMVQLMNWVTGHCKRINRVRLYHIGETWLHPEWPALCAKLKQENPGIVIMTSTNGMLLANRKARQQIIESGIDEIMFSIHGATQRSAIQYMGEGFDIYTVLSVVKDMDRLRKSMNASLKLIWKYLLFIWNDSEKEIETAKQLAAKNGVDEIHFSVPAHENASNRFRIGTEAWIAMRRTGDLSSKFIANYHLTAPTEAIYVVPAKKVEKCSPKKQDQIFMKPKIEKNTVALQKEVVSIQIDEKLAQAQHLASLGHQLLSEGHFRRALECLEGSIALNPAAEQWVFRDMGNLLVKLGEADKAIAIYQSALHHHETPSDFIFIGLAGAYKKIGCYSDAAHYLEKGLAAGNHINGSAAVEQAYIELFDSMRRSGITEGAASAYRYWLKKAYLVNHQYNVIYCPIPKNACTFFKTVLVENSDQRQRFEENKMSVHVFTRQKSAGFMLSDCKYLHDANYYKFAILRNPFDRLLSAFANLFIEPLRWDQPLEPVVKNVIDDIYLNLNQEVDYKKSITFHQFVHYLARTEDADLDYHWRPQHFSLGADGATFDLLGQFENMATVLQLLRKHTGLKINDRKYNPTNYEQVIPIENYAQKYPMDILSCGHIPGVKSFYTKNLSAIVRERYEEDIKIYKSEFGATILENGTLTERLIFPILTSSREPGIDDGKLAIDGGQSYRTKPFGPTWLIGDEERQQVLEVIDKASVNWRSGFKVEQFAQAFAKAYHTRHAIATSTGTAALHAAIYAVQTAPCDEIITTPITDIGTVTGILLQNAIPVFSDWDDCSFNMDPADIERKITERTRAIIVVHLFGNPCDMGSIMKIAKDHDLPVIEDCAQALLAEYQGQVVGTFGDLACFSFGQKTMTTHQGGMVITQNDKLAVRVREFISKGCKGGAEPRRDRRFQFLGSFYPMTDLQAAVGLAQLERLEKATAVRERTAKILSEAFSHLKGFSPPVVREGDRHTFYVYPFAMDPTVAGVSMQKFLAALRAEGIPGLDGPYLDGLPLHRYPLFADNQTYGDCGYPFIDDRGERRINYREMKFENCDRLLPHVGLIHMRNSFTEHDAKDIAGAILKVGKYYAQKKSPASIDKAACHRYGAPATPAGPDVLVEKQPQTCGKKEQSRSSDLAQRQKRQKGKRTWMPPLIGWSRKMINFFFRFRPKNSFDRQMALADQAFNEGQYREAARQYSIAISFRPISATAYFLLGKSYHYSKMYRIAAKAYMKAIELKPGKADYYHWLGGTLLEKGEIHGALLCYETAIRMNSKTPHYHRGRGYALSKANQFREAIAEFQTSIALDPDYFFAHTQLADTFVLTRDYKSAKASYQRALELQPDNQVVQAKLSGLVSADK